MPALDVAPRATRLVPKSRGLAEDIGSSRRSNATRLHSAWPCLGLDLRSGKVFLAAAEADARRNKRNASIAVEDDTVG